jgi:hypothetical protein
VTVPDADAALAWIARGATYITTPLEAVLAAGSRDYLSRARA